MRDVVAGSVRKLMQECGTTAGSPVTRIGVKYPPEKAKVSRWPIAPEKHQTDEKQGVKGDQTHQH
jgi:hypothetical protein